MKTNQKQSLITLLLGVLAGSLLTALISAIINSVTKYDYTWDTAWANSSSPVDLEWGGKGGKPDAERSSKPAGGSALD